MIDTHFLLHIRQQMSQGVSPDDIKQSLQNGGWSLAEIEEAFRIAGVTQKTADTGTVSYATEMGTAQIVVAKKSLVYNIMCRVASVFVIAAWTMLALESYNRVVPIAGSFFSSVALKPVLLSWWPPFILPASIALLCSVVVLFLINIIFWKKLVAPKHIAALWAGTAVTLGLWIFLSHSFPSLLLTTNGTLLEFCFYIIALCTTLSLYRGFEKRYEIAFNKSSWYFGMILVLLLVFLSVLIIVPYVL